MISSGASYSSKQFNAFALKKYFVRVAPLWNTLNTASNVTNLWYHQRVVIVRGFPLQPLGSNTAP